MKNFNGCSRRPNTIIFHNLKILNIDLKEVLKHCLIYSKNRQVFFLFNVQHYVAFAKTKNAEIFDYLKVNILNDSRIFQILLRLFLNQKISQVRGIDFLEEFFNELKKQKKKIKIYFLLTSDEADNCQELKTKIKKEYKFLKNYVFGKTINYSEIFRLNKNKTQRIIEQINKINPDILFVGWGVPAGHQWIAQNLAKINAKKIFEIGGGIDFFTGRRKKAPRWIIKLGLEWFFRLCYQPRKLWKRYFLHNPKFFVLLLQEMFKK